MQKIKRDTRVVSVNKTRDVQWRFSMKVTVLIGIRLVLFFGIVHTFDYCRIRFLWGCCGVQ